MQDYTRLNLLDLLNNKEKWEKCSSKNVYATQRKQKAKWRQLDTRFVVVLNILPDFKPLTIHFMQSISFVSLVFVIFQKSVKHSKGAYTTINTSLVHVFIKVLGNLQQTLASMPIFP